MRRTLRSPPSAPRPAPRALLIFVDGLGLGARDPASNPIYSGACPRLRRWLDRHATPVDATLDRPGLPQSATGQATLYTGRNAAAFMGRHMPGLPGLRLREFVARHNLLSELIRRGYTATFANAYFTDDIEEVRRRRWMSVTTAAALASAGRVRGRAEMLAGRAVYHDLTRAALRERGYTGPLLVPPEAAAHLLDIARAHDFTLFEFFQTDLAAHRGERAEIEAVLARLDAFLAALADGFRRRRELMLLTSDHGNLEDGAARRHTRNPVFFVAFGLDASTLRERERRLSDSRPRC